MQEMFAAFNAWKEKFKDNIVDMGGKLKPGGKMVIPAGLPDAQQLILVDKDGSGKVMTKEILPVRFSQLEGTEYDRRTRDVQ